MTGFAPYMAILAVLGARQAHRPADAERVLDERRQSVAASLACSGSALLTRTGERRRTFSDSR